MSSVWVNKGLVSEAVARRLVPVTSVIDVGPGIRPQQVVDARIHLCIEVHLPYIEALKKTQPQWRHLIFLNATWEEAFKLLPDQSADTIVALDFIEHLEKQDGQQFLAECSRVARKQIVIFTPLGFYPQSHGEGERDRWGMSGGYWQSHRSGWLPEDFGSGWDLVCCEEFHTVDENERPLAKPFGAIWAIKTQQASINIALTWAERKAALRLLLPARLYAMIRSIFKVATSCFSAR